MYRLNSKRKWTSKYKLKMSCFFGEFFLDNSNGLLNSLLNGPSMDLNLSDQIKIQHFKHTCYKFSGKKKIFLKDTGVI